MRSRPDGQEIVVATCADDAYLPLIWPLARSIGLANGLSATCVLHVFFTGSDHALAQRLSRLHVLRLRVEVHANDHDLQHLSRSDGLPPVTYLRLFLPELLPDEPRIIYIDGDAIVRRSLRPLFDTDFGGNLVAGVPDLMSARPGVTVRSQGVEMLASRYFADILGLTAGPYVNAGVLLMDLEALRATGFSQTAMQRSEQMRPFSVWQDQDVMNTVLAGRIGQLDEQWNVAPEALFVDPEPGPLRAAFARQWKRQSIVHFAGPAKPWNVAAVPFALHWLALAAFSPATRMMQWPGLPGFIASRRTAFGRRLRRAMPGLFAATFGIWQRLRRRRA